jgi:hypothetical protein
VIPLDTDHFSALKYRSNPRRDALMARMDRSADPDFALTTMKLEEQTRGWLAYVHAARAIHSEVPFYSLFVDLFRLRVRLAGRSLGRRGRRHLRAPAPRARPHRQPGPEDRLHRHDSKSLAAFANLRDFRQVPGLQVEDWLET